VREDLIGHADSKCPIIMDYKQMADMDSVYNTPCTMAVYVLGLVLDWIIAQGGVKGKPGVFGKLKLPCFSCYSNGQE